MSEKYSTCLMIHISSQLGSTVYPEKLPMINNEMRLSSVNKTRRNEHSYTMFAGISVNWKQLS